MQAKPEKLKFGYVIYPGNNPGVIQNALKKRNVWVSLSAEKQLLSACFVWKQLNLNAKTYDDFQQVMRCFPSRHILLNHFEANNVITTKSGLIRTLKYYYSHQLALSTRFIHVHDVIPTAYIVHANKNDTEYKDFVQRFQQIQKKNYQKEKLGDKHCEKNLWFIKPEADNQGKGIIVSGNFKEIEAFIVSKPVNSGWIVQKAIERPLLYKGRKFDIRVWVLVTPQLDVYYYNSPYIRTSSSIYSTDITNSEVHLTNNCQQKHFSDYSKYQEGNTIPMKESLLSYLEELPEAQGRSQELVDQFISKFKLIIVDTILSARKYFSKGMKKKQFQLFGYDFIIDEDFKVWLLQVNNNPYLGVPNKFIADLLPKMIDQMFQIVLDPLFPPQEYKPVQQKRYELIYKEPSIFRISPIRVSSNSNQTKYYKKQKSLSHAKPVTSDKLIAKSELYGLKDQKSSKPIYSTPVQTLKYLLENYCFNDLDPFFVPTTLILSSPSLAEDQFLQSSLKKLKFITQTRISRILLEPKIYELACNVIGQDKYNQQIKAALIDGFTNACKQFKAKIFIIRNLMPLLCENIRSYKTQAEQCFIAAVIKLAIATGGNFNRSVFIPGQSRENQFIRQLFIKSNTLKLLLYLKKKYFNIASQQVSAFLQNLSQKDWQIFYESSGNKAKRAYSPKVNTVPQSQEQMIIINSNVLHDDRPKVLSVRQNTQIKNFRMRRHSGAAQLRKE